jgi:acetyl-CoA C-acetyltransferase
VLLVSEDMARSLSDKPLYVAGSGHASDGALHGRSTLTSLPSVRLAAQQAYQMAGVSAADIDVAEVHDCFSIAEILVIEALALVEKGKGGLAAESGLTALGGRIPVNTSGGLKSKGHPVGATGVAQVVEITRQLRGSAGARQVGGARIGLTQNMGGTGGSSVIHIFEAL